MKLSIIKTTVIALVVILQLAFGRDITQSIEIVPPKQIYDGFKTGTLEDVNIDEHLIKKSIVQIQNGNYNEVHSLLIYKDEKLVLEEYFKGHKYRWESPYHHGEEIVWDENTLHGVKSVTKSITSACIGIAIDRGLIKNVHQSIFDYLPEQIHNKINGKERITIEHLLTMTSGLEWDEWGAPLSSPRNDIVGLWFPPCENQIECILQRPLESTPGSKFKYSGGNIILLGEILKRASNMSIDVFSTKYLFDPLGIDTSNWALRFSNGIIESAGGLEITPRSMTKIGVTFLNHGIWNDHQIISDQWVKKSSVPYKENHGINIPGVSSGKNGYSYSWWTNRIVNSGREIEIYNAGGWGGQEIFVIPDLNTVVVLTGGNYTVTDKNFKILEKYIIPAIN